MKIQKTYSCIQENVARKLPNVLCGHSEKDRRRISPIISAFDRMKNDSRYRISANSFGGNYSFLEVEVRKLFKGGNFSREETIVFFHFMYVSKKFPQILL